MDFSEANEFICYQEKKPSRNDLRELLSLIDLTTLNPNDNVEVIETLCKQAKSFLGSVASVCVYPKFLPVVIRHVNDPSINIVSVANFPTGNASLATTLTDIEQALALGANEMDIVFPYKMYKGGQKKEALDYIQKCKQVSGDNRLKVILEICEFSTEEVYTLSKEVIEHGADFIKTSTGKSIQGATLEGASTMLLAIKSSQRDNIGFKASGGIKHVQTALPYINLAKTIMGNEWVTSKNFRIGASALLDDIFAICANLDK